MKTIQLLTIHLGLALSFAAHALNTLPAYEGVHRLTPVATVGSTLQVWESLFYSPEDEVTLAGAVVAIDQVTQDAAQIYIKGHVVNYGSQCQSDARWTRGCDLSSRVETIEITAENAAPQTEVWNHYYEHHEATAANPYPRHQKGRLFLNGKNLGQAYPVVCTYGYVDQDTALSDRKVMSCGTFGSAHHIHFEAALKN